MAFGSKTKEIKIQYVLWQSYNFYGTELSKQRSLKNLNMTQNKTKNYIC